MPQTAPRPSILLFLTDDHGQWAAGCYGNGELLTPNLDYLAASGVRLANAFTPSPVCSPARASLLTGRLPSAHGIHDWLDERGVALGHPGLAGQPTLGTLLHAAGYRTGLVGKWHCGRSWEPASGFDRWFSFWQAQYPHRGELEFSDDGRRVVEKDYQASALTTRAVRFVRDTPPEMPFFLVVGYVCTHTPHREQPPRWVARYRGATFRDVPDAVPLPCHGEARFAWPHAPTARRAELAQYYAAVSFIDEQVGRVLDAVDAAGRLEDTLVVYVSDHGHMNGHHGLHTKGNATVPQNFLEESIRVPCLLSWPAGLPAGGVRVEPTDHCDLFQTLLDAAGVGSGAPGSAEGREPPAPGRSMLPLLRGEAAGWREVQFAEYGNARMARTVRHKLVRRWPGPAGRFGDELYDLVADPGETENRIDDPAAAGVVEELSRLLQEHFARHQDPARAGTDIARQPPCNPAEPWARR